MDEIKTSKDDVFRTRFAGADWVKKNLKRELSPLGVKVADVLGEVFRGIYHLPDGPLLRAKWDDAFCIDISVRDGLATYDFDELTRLVFACHDACIRCEICSSAPRYLKLRFHNRKRNASVYERHPTLFDAHFAHLVRRKVDEK